MRILILGVSGQDGSILAEKYRDGGHEVIGVNLKPKANASDGIKVLDFDFSNPNESKALLERFKPDRIFHLAAVHSSSALLDAPIDRNHEAIFRCNVEITRNILEWQKLDKNCTSLIALSSQMYSSNISGRTITETSEFAPRNYYAETKVEALSLIKEYRERYKTKSFGAILFNHTSSRSKAEFLFPQLVTQIREVLEGQRAKLYLQDPDAELDICCAFEICQALVELVELSEPTDYVLARGNSIRIRDLISNVFGILSFDGYYEIVTEKSKNIGESGLVGDSTKVFRALGWKANLSPEEIFLAMLGMPSS